VGNDQNAERRRGRPNSCVPSGDHRVTQITGLIPIVINVTVFKEC